MLEYRLNELTKEAIHVAFSSREETFQEADVTPVSGYQEGNVGQALSQGQRESCRSTGELDVGQTARKHDYGALT